MPTELETEFIVETAEEKLLRLGLQQVISGTSNTGVLPVIPVTYRASEYKVDERYSITQELPRDAGYGYVFTNLTNTEV